MKIPSADLSGEPAPRARRPLLLALLLLSLGVPGAVWARREDDDREDDDREDDDREDDGREDDDREDDDRGYDHDDVWRGRAEGRILPLDQILAALPPGARRRVVEIEFDEDDGVPLYEIKYIDDAGRLVEVEIDARNGAVLGREVD